MTPADMRNEVPKVLPPANLFIFIKNKSVIILDKQVIERRNGITINFFMTPEIFLYIDV